LAAELDAGRDVYCYFNNDYFGHAVDDAKWLRSALCSVADRTAIRRDQSASLDSRRRGNAVA
jgi:uncharacterized protein YecE (DUF72 family)